MATQAHTYHIIKLDSQLCSNDMNLGHHIASISHYTVHLQQASPHFLLISLSQKAMESVSLPLRTPVYLCIYHVKTINITKLCNLTGILGAMVPIISPYWTYTTKKVAKLISN